MTVAATAVAALQVVAVETLAVALVEAVRAQALIQVQARRRLRPSNLALLGQVLTVSALAPVVLQIAKLQSDSGNQVFINTRLSVSGTNPLLLWVL